MDELKSLLNAAGKGRDMSDRLLQILDRQTDHKLSPHLLLGFMGLFSLMSIMNIVQIEVNGIKEIARQPDGDGDGQVQSLADMVSGALQGKGAGQPDLMGLLSTALGKKSINPNLLLSLFSLLNNQAGAGGQSGTNSSSPAGASSGTAGPAGSESNRDGEGEQMIPAGETEKKNNADKGSMELRYERKRGAGERA